MVCRHCGGTMKVIAFLTDYAVVDRIINHLKLTFAAERPPPPQLAFQEYLMPAEAPAEYTMGRSEIGGGTSISPAQQKNEFTIITLGQ